MVLREILHARNEQWQQPNKFYGVAIGFVVDLRDPDHLGRVKLNIPELFLEEQNEAVFVTQSNTESRGHSYFARVATLMAGGKRGSYFVPEVGDEVVVAFEQGDMNRPMIIGSLWNSEGEPPESMDSDGKNDIRAIHTRSGHKIVFNDSDDKPSILIVDKTKENSIFIDSANNKMEIKVKGDLNIEVGGKLTIQAKQDISAETKANLEIKATGSGNLETKQALTVKSGMGVTVEGLTQAEVKAPQVSVNGSGMTEVKGGLVKIN